ncbi:MATE family efflux transporter [Lachnospiraceae bacterium NSJ-143]|nr:MATE family efflux transporter [Lachnospiraceae bacterium NSJ-143]
MENRATILNYGKTPAHTVFKLSWPAIAEQFLICFVSLADMAMVGSIGAFATASVAITAPVIWFINGFNTALCTAFMFIVARYIGMGKINIVHKSVRQALTASLLCGIIITIAAELIAARLPVWMGAQTNVTAPAAAYFSIVGISLFAVTVSTVVSGVMRAAGNTKLPLFANIGANILNVVGNFLLIYPERDISVFGNSIHMFGAGMGVSGAAVSTAASHFALAFFLVVMLYRKDTPVRIGLRGDYRITGKILKDMLRIGIPVCIERCSLSLGHIFLTAMISGLGTASLAAHYITDQAEGLFYLPSYGLADSATALIGQSLGAKEEKLADRFAWLVCVINIIAIALMCIPVFIFSQFVVSLFSNDAEVIYKGTQTLRLAAGAEVFFSLYIVISGICRGAGDVKIPLAAGFIGMWVIRLGCCYLLAYKFGLGVVGIWLGIDIDTVFRGVVCMLRIKGGKWKYAWKH